jgi:DNA end-binding protein Ku
MSRALWKGAISFGLVYIPVELHPAEQRKEMSFSMLDKRDFSPVGYRRYNKKTGKEVAWDDIVKGYEYEKDRYVVVSDEDFRRANVEASQTVDIAAFVPATDIPPQFFETPYYLVPTERGKKVYALLRDTLKQAKKVAVAQVVIRTTPHLAAVIPIGPVLVLNTLRYASEMRGIDDLSLPGESPRASGVTAKEAELARKLVDDMSEAWKPAQFVNTYTRDLMKRIEEKISSGQTHEITAPEEAPAAPRGSNVIDLTTLLQRSLEGKGRRASREQAASAIDIRQAPRKRPRKAAATTAHPRASAARRKRA